MLILILIYLGQYAYFICINFCLIVVVRPGHHSKIYRHSYFLRMSSIQLCNFIYFTTLLLTQMASRFQLQLTMRAYVRCMSNLIVISCIVSTILILLSPTDVNAIESGISGEVNIPFQLHSMSSILYLQIVWHA